jgi:hypothetical protein
MKSDMNTIVTDLVKALGDTLAAVKYVHSNSLEIDGLLHKAIIDSERALARAKQELDLDKAEVKFFYSSLRDLTHCKVLFDNDVEVLCIPLRPTNKEVRCLTSHTHAKFDR